MGKRKTKNKKIKRQKGGDAHTEKLKAEIHMNFGKISEKLTECVKQKDDLKQLKGSEKDWKMVEAGYIDELDQLQILITSQKEAETKRSLLIKRNRDLTARLEAAQSDEGPRDLYDAIGKVRKTLRHAVGLEGKGAAIDTKTPDAEVDDIQKLVISLIERVQVAEDAAVTERAEKYDVIEKARQAASETDDAALDAQQIGNELVNEKKKLKEEANLLTRLLPLITILEDTSVSNVNKMERATGFYGDLTDYERSVLHAAAKSGTNFGLTVDLFMQLFAAANDNVKQIDELLTRFLTLIEILQDKSVKKEKKNTALINSFTDDDISLITGPDGVGGVDTELGKAANLYKELLVSSEGGGKRKTKRKKRKTKRKKRKTKKRKTKKRKTKGKK